jgi:hypothetical protein
MKQEIRLHTTNFGHTTQTLVVQHFICVLCKETLRGWSCKFQRFIFVEQSSTKERTHQPPLPPNSEANEKIYESGLITEHKVHIHMTLQSLQFYIQFYSVCMHNFKFFTLSQFKKIQAWLNHRANARSCLKMSDRGQFFYQLLQF